MTGPASSEATEAKTYGRAHFSLMVTHLFIIYISVLQSGKLVDNGKSQISRINFQNKFPVHPHTKVLPVKRLCINFPSMFALNPGEQGL